MDPVAQATTSAPVRFIERLQVRIVGIVQGVGFRPFVYRLARDLNLNGWVQNDGNGVTVEVEGRHSRLLEFLDRLHRDKPASSLLYALDHRFVTPAGYSGFKILASQSSDTPQAWILPDLATCVQCREEIKNPLNRRYRYPFTNCTHCGPRFTLIESLPYDRIRTSMSVFQMCPECGREYSRAEDRRFHAQPNACPHCGPQLAFYSTGRFPAERAEALQAAVDSIRNGKIIALKGLGGYQLIADASREATVAELRRRKKRPHKAFAVMYPSLERLEQHVEVHPLATSMLRSSQAPIILLPRKPLSYAEIAPSVAPRSPYLGVFLPYTPLHWLLLHDLGIPLVATSGNFSDEPIQYEDGPALEMLSPLCDAFLLHNRKIVHHADDSVMHFLERPRVVPQMLRRARGYAPLPLLALRELPPLLGLGGHLNTTFALSRGREIIQSQHLGDLYGQEAREVYFRTLENFRELYQVFPEAVVHDLHPDYFTTRLAENLGLPRVCIQHHHAHLAAAVLENQIETEVLGFTWDGTGYGTDGTVWGGEVLMGGAAHSTRVATLVPFQLPGGEKAIHEPWRTALSLLWETFGPDIPQQLPLFKAATPAIVESVMSLVKNGHSGPLTTSMGRLFDGVSAILGISLRNTHQGESAQLMEYAAWRGTHKLFLPLPVIPGSILRMDWRHLVRALVWHLQAGVPVEDLALSFHQALTSAAVDIAQKVGCSHIVMTGGVFCNRLLTESLLTALEETGKRAYPHSQLPPHDGNLAAGQIWAAVSGAGCS
ncbi:MAG: carbamoyltransferase HypF [Acidobacteria bacterium]|nr:carbamoyltransferase HypF [Acidobacteriota bacterium]